MNSKNLPKIIAGLSVLWVLMVIALVHGSHFYINRFGQPPQQPIEFSHAVHVNSLNVECLFCHESAEKSIHATLPAGNICLSCHEGLEPQNTEVEKMLNILAEKGEIEWQRVYSVKDHVYFSHRVHTSVAQITCGECHGPIENMTVAINTAGGASSRGFLEMGWCVTCHRQQNASLECITCHK